MAAGNVTLYSAAVLGFGQATFNLSTDNYNVVLVTTSYTPQPDVDTLYSDVSGFEVATGGGYTTGGVALGGATWTRSGATSTFAAQSAAWSGSTISARYAVLVRRSGVSLVAGDRLLSLLDLTGGGNASSTASVFQVNWNNSTTSSANTVFTLTHNP